MATAAYQENRYDGVTQAGSTALADPSPERDDQEVSAPLEARHAACVLAPEPSSGRAARQFVQETLEDWGWPQPGSGARAVQELQDILLLTSELAINAADHARSLMEVSVHYSAGAKVRVEVRDEGPGIPVMHQPATFEESGRGLALVDLLSRTWGVASAPPGKVVWFELQLD